MIHMCRECGSECEKIFSLVETHWCPISTEILHREWRLICEKCYRAWQRQSIVEYAKEQLEKVVEKPVEQSVEMAAEIGG
jgi:hypothetical protein